MSSDNKISVKTYEIKKNKKKNLTLHRATYGATRRQMGPHGDIWRHMAPHGATRRHSYKLMVSAVSFSKIRGKI